MPPFIQQSSYPGMSRRMSRTPVAKMIFLPNHCRCCISVTQNSPVDSPSLITFSIFSTATSANCTRSYLASKLARAASRYVFGSWESHVGIWCIQLARSLRYTPESKTTVECKVRARLKAADRPERPPPMIKTSKSGSDGYVAIAVMEAEGETKHGRGWKEMSGMKDALE